MNKIWFLVILVLASCFNQVAGGATDTETGAVVSGTIHQISAKSQVKVYLSPVLGLPVAYDSTTLNSQGQFSISIPKGATLSRLIIQINSQQYVLLDSIGASGGGSYTNLNLSMSQTRPYLSIPYLVDYPSSMQLLSTDSNYNATLMLFDSLNILLNLQNRSVIWHHYPARWIGHASVDSTVYSETLDSNEQRLVLSTTRNSANNWNYAQHTVWMQPYVNQVGQMPLGSNYLRQFVYLASLGRSAIAQNNTSIVADSNHLDQVAYTINSSIMNNIYANSWDSLSYQSMLHAGIRWWNADTIYPGLYAQGLKLQVQDSVGNPIAYAVLRWHRVDPVLASIQLIPDWIDTCNGLGQMQYSDTLYLNSSTFQNFGTLNYRVEVCRNSICNRVWIPFDAWINGQVTLTAP